MEPTLPKVFKTVALNTRLIFFGLSCRMGSWPGKGLQIVASAFVEMKKDDIISPYTFQKVSKIISHNTFQKVSKVISPYKF